MTRQELRGVIDPEFIGELSQKPINAFQDSEKGIKISREVMWKMFIAKTILPYCSYQIKKLQQYRHLLTKEEQQVADDYAHAIAQYEKDWRTKPFSFPPQSKEFLKLLR